MAPFCTWQGNLLPLFAGEENWPNALRLILYLLGLAYLFLAVAIISDIFMTAIEKITSAKRCYRNKHTGRKVTVVIWNGTVANLTLMALGSSAPEILLNIAEVAGDEFFIGSLGCGTIVGSAAFNLLMISAVCVCSLPDNDIRYIKEVPVYVITATFSVFAYLWLFIILQLWTPNICTIEEAVITLLFFPLLIVLAFLADKGYFTKGGDESISLKANPLGPDSTVEELAEAMAKIREVHGSHISDEQVMKIMKVEYGAKHSRAHYRHAAMGKVGAGKRLSLNNGTAGAPDRTVTAVHDTADVKDREIDVVELGFASSQYAFMENCGNAVVTVVRKGHEHTRAKVHYCTRAGTATENSDYTRVEGDLEFAPNETEKTIEIPILDDDEVEEDEEFYVDLTAPEVTDADRNPVKGIQAKLSDVPVVTIIIVDDDVPGILRFENDEKSVEEAKEDQEINIVVERINGASGTIGCSYYTENGSAVAGYDFEEAKGTLELAPNVQRAVIPITIKAKVRSTRGSFRLYINEATGTSFDPSTDGGEEQCICSINIEPNSANTAMLDRLTSNINWSQVALGHANWKSQFQSAIWLSCDEDDEDDSGEPGWFDYVMHAVSMPWKLLFAFVPPVDYCGGWACFAMSLCFIGAITAIVGDMANLVGCTLGIEPEITAITFVALGTSLPDTFASMTAAAMEPYADASIGNVTGSNSVNVFLGFGLPWTLCSIYWAVNGATAEWTRRLMSADGTYYSIRDTITPGLNVGDAVFIVPAGTLWFNLVVFTVCALTAIAFLAWRRKTYGGELGGPKKACYAGAGFLSFLWFAYIAASSVWTTLNSAR
eukprot:TRINITY_DN13037_c0_g3_i1.p1 TRINITY_DN13037_c0_g3~~TRINITY_DN13037_c0_g3_i1.p1  ORF type:complete len:830 (-),score=195.01 TRINITY_DN13037_c0_g3_i1:191-2680(-)